MLRQGQRYLDTRPRYPAENAVMQKFKAQATIDILAGSKLLAHNEVDNSKNVYADANIQFITRESPSILSLDLPQPGKDLSNNFEQAGF